MMGTDECPAISVYDRNVTIPAPASMFEEHDVGRPFGKLISKYWIMEVHYSTPDLEGDILDSSGES